MDEMLDRCVYRKTREYLDLKELCAEYGISRLNEGFIDEFLSGDKIDESMSSLFFMSSIVDAAMCGLNSGLLAPVPWMCDYVQDYGIGYIISKYTAVWHACMLFNHFISNGDYFAARDAADAIGVTRALYEEQET